MVQMISSRTIQHCVVEKLFERQWREEIWTTALSTLQLHLRSVNCSHRTCWKITTVRFFLVTYGSVWSEKYIEMRAASSSSCDIRLSVAQLSGLWKKWSMKDKRPRNDGRNLISCEVSVGWDKKQHFIVVYFANFSRSFCSNYETVTVS